MTAPTGARVLYAQTIRTIGATLDEPAQVTANGWLGKATADVTDLVVEISTRHRRDEPTVTDKRVSLIGKSRDGRGRRTLLDYGSTPGGACPNPIGDLPEWVRDVVDGLLAIEAGR